MALFTPAMAENASSQQCCQVAKQLPYLTGFSSYFSFPAVT
jgi:hypothetical protein